MGFGYRSKRLSIRQALRFREWHEQRFRQIVESYSRGPLLAKILLYVQNIQIFGLLFTSQFLEEFQNTEQKKFMKYVSFSQLFGVWAMPYWDLQPVAEAFQYVVFGMIILVTLVFVADFAAYFSQNLDSTDLIRTEATHEVPRSPWVQAVFTVQSFLVKTLIYYGFIPICVLSLYLIDASLTNIICYFNLIFSIVCCYVYFSIHDIDSSFCAPDRFKQRDNILVYILPVLLFLIALSSVFTSPIVHSIFFSLVLLAILILSQMNAPFIEESLNRIQIQCTTFNLVAGLLFVIASSDDSVLRSLDLFLVLLLSLSFSLKLGGIISDSGVQRIWIAQTRFSDFERKIRQIVFLRDIQIEDYL